MNKSRQEYAKKQENCLRNETNGRDKEEVEVLKTNVFRKRTKILQNKMY